MNLPRYPLLASGQIRAKKHELERVEVAPPAAALEKVRLIVPEEERGQVQVLGEGAAAAPRVVEVLRELGGRPVILVLAEHDRGVLNEVTHEAIAFARSLGGGPVEALLVGKEARPLAEHLAVERVRVAVDPRLEDYAPAAWAACVAQLQPEVVVGPGTDRGHEVLAHAAARLEAPLAANCVAAESGEPLRVTRQRWGGSLLEEALVHGPVKLLTVAPHVLAPAEPGAAGVVDEFAPELTEADLLVRISRREELRREGAARDARVVVGGGRGVGSGGLRSSRGARRVAWRRGRGVPRGHESRLASARRSDRSDRCPYRPDLYIACGVSGAIQHMVGCKGAKRILAINKDPNAPMVARADYAVIGDLNEIFPAIVAELGAAAGQGKSAASSQRFARDRIRQDIADRCTEVSSALSITHEAKRPPNRWPVRRWRMSKPSAYVPFRNCMPRESLAWVVSTTRW